MSTSRPIRIRILLGSTIALGPGKVDLLDAIAETGSISAAARVMRMSYRRAWLLVHTMNDSCQQPLVEAVKGGKDGGGARITPAGREVLSAYRDVLYAARSRLAPYLRTDGEAKKPAARGSAKPKKRARR